MHSVDFIEVFGKHAVAVRLDERIYNTSVIAKSSFRFADKVACLLAHDEDDHNFIRCIFFPKGSQIDFDELMPSFFDELLDQKLRHQLDDQFNDLRLIITAQAFAEGNLLNPEDDVDDFNSDPRSLGRIR